MFTCVVFSVFCYDNDWLSFCSKLDTRSSASIHDCERTASKVLVRASISAAATSRSRPALPDKKCNIVKRHANASLFWAGNQNDGHKYAQLSLFLSLSLSYPAARWGEPTIRPTKTSFLLCGRNPLCSHRKTCTPADLVPINKHRSMAYRERLRGACIRSISSPPGTPKIAITLCIKMSQEHGLRILRNIRLPIYITRALRDVTDGRGPLLTNCL